jgi:hypothetical protein
MNGVGLEPAMAERVAVTGVFEVCTLTKPQCSLASECQIKMNGQGRGRCNVQEVCALVFSTIAECAVILVGLRANRHGVCVRGYSAFAAHSSMYAVTPTQNDRLKRGESKRGAAKAAEQDTRAVGRDKEVRRTVLLLPRNRCPEAPSGDGQEYAR